MFVFKGLLCNKAVAEQKEYNSRRRFDTKHGAKYANRSYQEKKQEV